MTEKELKILNDEYFFGDIYVIAIDNYYYNILKGKSYKVVGGLQVQVIIGILYPDGKLPTYVDHKHFRLDINYLRKQKLKRILK